MIRKIEKVKDKIIKEIFFVDPSGKYLKELRINFINVIVVFRHFQRIFENNKGSSRVKQN